MERLTKQEYIDNPPSIKAANLPSYTSVYWRLADYENTELTPQEIENLHNKYSTLLEMYDKLQKERDSWKRDAIQYGAKLGEYRIARQQERCGRCKLEDTDRCKEC